MATATFDTLKFANDLKAAGVPPQQAEAEAKLFSEVFAVNFKELVTKDDLRTELKNAVWEIRDDFDNKILKLDGKIVGLDSKIVGLDNKIENVRTELKNEIRETEQRLNAKIDNLSVKVFEEMTLLKWMMTLSITLNVGVLLRLFLGRPM